MSRLCREERLHITLSVGKDLALYAFEGTI